ncbi:8033_t:CDS:2 [Racocetra fulgida]|uniref:8033_t:CDS:1 n=1 Tax=Racocetra fulgida TaxID=60492 RepID=A0A9N8VY33_9GLOM|nr:8033_t:CDS:2 [Racocetra fulgida]
MPVDTKMKNPREYRDLWKHITHRRGWGYPDVLDVQGSVFWNIVPLLVFTALWTVFIVVLYMCLEVKAIAVSSNLKRNEQDRLEKETCIKLLLGYVVAVKHHIRFEFGIRWKDLDDLLPEGFQKTYYEGSAAQVEETSGDRSLLAVLPTSIRTISNKIPPTAFRSVLMFSKEEKEALFQEHEKELTPDAEADAKKQGGRMDSSRFGLLVSALDELIDILGNLERIGGTPLPIAYNIHL